MHPAIRFRRATALALTAFISLAALGQSPPPSPDAAVTLAPMVVTGVQPGPALWKVSKDGHVMWVLGITSPLPKGMRWDSSKVERLIASSQHVLRPPSLEIGVKAGFWGQLFLIPSMIGLKKLPDGETLQQVLPPDLYRRWLVQKNKYLRYSWGVERLRPTFAGEKLYGAALSRSGLADGNVVEKAVYAAAGRDKVAITNTSYQLMLADPHSAAKQFKQMTMNDQQCLTDSLDAIDQDFSQATERANAWATGDLQALGKILSARQQDDCLSAIGSTDFAKKIGMTDISRRERQAWIKAAEGTLTHDAQSVALLPMENLLGGDGYLSGLQADGYTVQSPEP